PWIFPSRYAGNPIGIRRRVPTSRVAVELVGGWTRATVCFAIPVRPVVARMLLRLSIVGDFVMLVAGRGQRAVCQQILGLEGVLGNFGDVFPRDPASQRRVGLDREAV